MSRGDYDPTKNAERVGLSPEAKQSYCAKSRLPMRLQPETATGLLAEREALLAIAEAARRVCERYAAGSNASFEEIVSGQWHQGLYGSCDDLAAALDRWEKHQS